MSIVWDVTHSYERILANETISELKIDNEFSLLLSFGYRVYDDRGSYVDVKFKRGGTNFDDPQKGSFIFLKNHMIVHHHWANIGGEYYNDIDLIAIWEKGKGVKIAYESTEESVDIVLNCSATPTDNGDGTYSCGNLVINPVAGTVEVSGNTITISGGLNTLIVVSIGIDSKLDVENNKMGIANQDGEITASSVSKGIKITLVGGATGYLRQDDFPQLYELIETTNNRYQHGGQWALVNSNGVQIPLLLTSFGTTQRDTDSVMRVGYNIGDAFRSTVYLNSDSGFNNTYFMLILPVRTVWGFKDNLVGFAFEGDCRRANDTKVAEVSYSVTVDLTNAKAIRSRSLNALGSFTAYQEAGLSMSLVQGGPPRKMVDGTNGVKVYQNGSWVTKSLPGSGYNYMDGQAFEYMLKDIQGSVQNISLSEIIVPRSLKTNRTITYRVGIGFNGEAGIYPRTESQSWSSGQYIKEIFLTYHGKPDDFGSTLESKAEVPSSLDSYDFTKVINDSSALQAYGFDDGLIYNTYNDTYGFASDFIKIPTQITLTIQPL